MGNLERAHKGTFHYFSTKHSDRYVTEFARRHGERDSDTINMMGRVAFGMNSKRLKYSDLVR